MTTEDDFNRRLDAHPEDWQTRLVFADWLDERGDVRAEGYRVLGDLRVSPCHLDSSVFSPEDRLRIPLYKNLWWWCTSREEKFVPHFLPDWWHTAIHQY